MTTISFSPVKKGLKQRPFRYAFLFTASRFEKKRLKQSYCVNGFEDCYDPTKRKKAKNGASVSVWKIPAAPVAIRLFKQVLKDENTRYKGSKRGQLHDFINFLIADSKKVKRNGESAEILPDSDERQAEHQRDKLRKSPYSKKLATYKEAILDKWTANGQIETVFYAIEQGNLGRGTMTGKELRAKRKKKSARSARLMKS